MKNLLLGALVMLMGTFSLAGEKSVNDSTILEVGTCTYTIVTTVTTTSGNQYSYTTTYVTEANSQKHCEMIAKAHVRELQMASN